MHGAGNDYIYVDCTQVRLPEPARLAALWSDRHKGIGGDGLVLICPPETSEGDLRMRMFNNDGSEGRMCGNASRCIAKYAYDHHLVSRRDIRLETLSGLKTLHITELDARGRVQRVCVDMGEPRLSVPDQFSASSQAGAQCTVRGTGGKEWPGTFVSMGNPHFVIFTPDVLSLDIEREGRPMERATVFPERCNVEFATLRPDGTLRMRVWERGTGITQACGTGACATAVAAVLRGLTPRSVRIEMDGGTLSIRWDEQTGHVLMTGPATEVFQGTIDLMHDA